ncbi:unnamed protein product [Miscanthus lutarioriparius]|uniref:D-isomer specific 2-hydroxyacid dehydrogenase catalytic domain-containing protein n=1 Tax=Miscanthus lutarioriparius TaxID=422564 RepID=A0A811QSQ4_9POAL|nr:unnamed protein product [Miscanthus lutarioriparius]
MASAAAAAATAAEQLVLPALLLIRRVDGPFAAALRQRFRVLDFFASGSPPPRPSGKAGLREPPRAAGVMGGPARVDADFLDALPSLRCVVSTAAGIDHIDLHECARRGVAVANAGRAYSANIADHVVCMLIDVLRRCSSTCCGASWCRSGSCVEDSGLCRGTTTSAPSSVTSVLASSVWGTLVL